MSKRGLNYIYNHFDTNTEKADRNLALAERTMCILQCQSEVSTDN